MQVLSHPLHRSQSQNQYGRHSAIRCSTNFGTQSEHSSNRLLHDGCRSKEGSRSFFLPSLRERFTVLLRPVAVARNGLQRWSPCGSAGARAFRFGFRHAKTGFGFQTGTDIDNAFLGWPFALRTVHLRWVAPVVPGSTAGQYTSQYRQHAKKRP